MNIRKLTLYVLFFFIAALPRQAFANPVVLLGAAALGASLLATSAGTYYAQNGVAPSYVTATANAAASFADAVFQPSYFAQYAGSLFTPSNLTQAKDYWFAQAASVGMTIGNIVNSVNNAASGLYPALVQLISSATNTYIDDNPVENGYFQSDDGVVHGIGGYLGWTFISTSAWYSWKELPGAYFSGTPWNFPMVIYNPNDHMTYIIRGYYNGYTNLSCDKYGNGSPPPFSNVPDPAALKNGLVNALAEPSSTSADELRKLFASNPSFVIPSATVAPPSVTAADGAPPAVTTTQKADILKKNAQDVATTAANNAGERAAANPTDGTAQAEAEQAAVTASQQAADAAEAAKPEEEKFSSIASQGFSTAYNPGQFDIPARFTTFVNTVKSSPLFSFSNGFFNSLPGGGSPIYEIDAGQYGHHTIDLSQTMSTGLAVLKTILLACFGFLSIRAVIMKR